MLCCMIRKTDAFPQSPVLSTSSCFYFLPRWNERGTGVETKRGCPQRFVFFKIRFQKKKRGLWNEILVSEKSKRGLKPHLRLKHKPAWELFLRLIVYKRGWKPKGSFWSGTGCAFRDTLETTHTFELWVFEAAKTIFAISLAQR